MTPPNIDPIIRKAIIVCACALAAWVVVIAAVIVWGFRP